MHQTQSSRYLVGFSNEKSAGRRYKCFLLDKSYRKIYTISPTVLRQQSESDVMTPPFGHFARSAIY
jgi:hypothetical protein